jgi:putative membrane protein
MMYGWMGGGMMWMGLFWLLIIGGVVWAVITVTNSKGSQPEKLKRKPSRTDDAEAILRERYANGELSDEEFRQKREELRS